MRERIRKDIKSGKIKVSEEEERHLYSTLMNYYRSLRTGINGDAFSISGDTSSKPGKKHIDVDFDKVEARKLYNICFEKPVALLHDGIAKAAEEGVDAAVLLKGGSFYNDHVRKQTRMIVHDAGLRCLDHEGSDRR